ncbi:MAG TPA: polysaccharide deacetylase family protein [Tissierellaceae bacterium]
MRLIIIKKNILFIISIILALTIIIFIINLLYGNVRETFNSDVYYRGDVDDKIVAFACNVDWGNEYIPEMLKIFNDYNIRITYFVTGRWAENNREILKQIYESGHEIGNHGYNHVDYDKLTYEKNREEIEKTHNIIKEILDMDAKYFAPPSGAYNENTIKASKDLGYKLIMWSVDTIDWRKDSTKDIIIKRVIEKIHNSAIVLMHPTEETVKALPEIIDYLKSNGYEIGKISDIIKDE